MARAPAITAPMHMLMLAISSSAWIAMPPQRGNWRIIWIKIEVAGEMGYPAKKLQPASSAPRTMAVAPSRYSRVDSGIAVVFVAGLDHAWNKINHGVKKQTVCGFGFRSKRPRR